MRNSLNPGTLDPELHLDLAQLDAWQPHPIKNTHSTRIWLWECVGGKMSHTACCRDLSRKDALAEMGLVSASIVHEVKNALQGAAGALYVLDHDPNLDAKQRRLIAIARRELSRAVEASRQTLALVRHETPAPVSIPGLLDETLGRYSGKIAHKGITIERRYDYKGSIEANPGAISEVFSNIVLNALEAMPSRGGKLVIRSLAHTRRNGNEVQGVRILFDDNGPGIPDKYKKKIFEPLFSTKKGKGTGLGLWVSEKLVHQQHGALELLDKTRAATGSCFSVFLPLTQN